MTVIVAWKLLIQQVVASKALFCITCVSLFAVMFVTVQQYGKMAADNGMKLSGYIHPFINTHKAAMIIKYKNTQSTMNRKKYTKGIK